MGGLASQRDLEHLGIAGEVGQGDDDVIVAPIRQCEWGVDGHQLVREVVDDATYLGRRRRFGRVALREWELEGRGCHRAFGAHVVLGECDREAMEVLPTPGEPEFCNNGLVISIDKLGAS